jgi:hypothetical protein
MQMKHDYEEKGTENDGKELELSYSLQRDWINGYSSYYATIITRQQ